MIIHRLTKGGPANYNQLDVDYCCHPAVQLFDLAKEACALNPELVYTAKPGTRWHEIEYKLAAQALAEKHAREEQERLSNDRKYLMSRLLGDETNATS